MVVSILLLILGFVILVKGAELLVEGSSSLAAKFSIPPIAIGLTIVAFGTSAPELIVNILAGFKGHHDIAFGNILGSNIFNTLLVLGIAGLIYPLSVKKSTVLKEIPIMLIVTVGVFLLASNFKFKAGILSGLDGIILLICLVSFLYYVTKISGSNDLEVDIKIFSGTKTAIYIVLGIIGLFFGGKFVVTHAVFIAKMLSVSDKFIALTVVALGTSLPELVTSVIAVRKKHCDLAIGNVVGSNIFNLLLVLGTTSLIKPIAYNPALNPDFYFLIFITLILFIAMYTFKKHKLDRIEAALFVVLYIAYTVFLFYRK
jgi:cation:H+ antiporter